MSVAQLLDTMSVEEHEAWLAYFHVKKERMGKESKR